MKKHCNNITLTIGGIKIKGVLVKDLKVTNKEKYIPKVGEDFEWRVMNEINNK